MELKRVKEFIDLAKTEGVSELKFESKDFKIAVSFNSQSNYIPQTFVQPNTSTVQTKSEESKGNSKGYYEIKSPFVGTFYASASPGEPPFVKVGDKVKKGQTLCILEAMKIMNEIESDCDGEVVEICLENENLVEYGEVLFRIRK